MKIYKEKVIPAETREYVVKRSCDICNLVSDSADWPCTSNYAINETEISITIRHKDGSNYPDGGNGTETQIDLCPKCFKDKLIPWLQSQGASISIEDWDW